MNQSLSTEAQRWLANRPAEESIRLDFSRIEDERAAYFASCAEPSERAITRHGLELEEVEFGGVQCTQVVSRAGSANGRLVYFFGGGFMVGSPRADLPIIGALAEHCAVDVIAPHYRLAPEHPAPAAVEDCMTVYRVVSGAHEGSLLLAGESAGGNLALRIAQLAVVEGVRSADAVALLSPAVDLRVDPELFAPGFGSDPTLQPERMLDVLDVYVAGGDVHSPSISPAFGSMANLPPTIVTTGTRDLFMNMCVRLHQRMRRAGVDVECNVWDGLWHVFEFYDEYPEAGESLVEIASFLNRHR